NVQAAGQRANREVASGCAAAGELERGDARLPIECAVARNVFVRVPERAIVRRINTHGTIIAPARKIRAGLRTRAVDNRSFTLVHDSGRTGGQSSGIINLRMEAAAGRAVTERHV